MRGRARVLLLLVAFLFAGAALAQEVTPTAAAPTPVVTAPAGAGNAVNMNAQIIHILLLGGMIFATIAGLQNIPFFEELFVKYPKLAVIVNGALSLCGALVVCMKSADTPTMLTCILTALGAFLTAAGIHLVTGKPSAVKAVVADAATAQGKVT